MSMLSKETLLKVSLGSTHDEVRGEETFRRPIVILILLLATVPCLSSGRPLLRHGYPPWLPCVCISALPKRSNV
jgi:hypothetical protein